MTARADPGDRFGRVPDEDEPRLDDADGDPHQRDEHDAVTEALVLVGSHDVGNAAHQEDHGADQPHRGGRDELGAGAGARRESAPA